jgi:hypothetical protein
MITLINFIFTNSLLFSAFKKRLIEKIYYFLHLDFNLNFDSHLLSLNLHLCSNLSSHIGKHTLHFFTKSFIILTTLLNTVYASFDRKCGQV